MAVSSLTTEGVRVALDAITANPAAGPLTALMIVDTHDWTTDPTYVAAIVADEIAATGYTRQAVTVAGLTPQADGRVTAEFDPTAFGALGGALDATIGGCYLYAETGNDATSPVLFCVPFTSAQKTDGTPVTINWHPISVTMRQGI